MTYSSSGQGGVWLDNSGGVHWQAVAAATNHWKLLPNSTGDWQTKATGSVVTTAPFHIGAGHTLNVNATLLTAHSQPVGDVGFGLLLAGSHVKAVLFARRPDDSTLWGDQGPIDENTFAPTDPTVTLTHTQGGLINVKLGTVQYGTVEDGSSCTGQCSCQLTASCTPAPGTYALLFGMFGIPFTSGLRPAAMIASFSH